MTARKTKRWSQMTTAELAAATEAFDDPSYHPPVLRPTRRELAQLHHVQQKAARSRFRIALALEKELVERTDEYAADHGLTFSDVVADALRRLIQKKSA